MSTTTSAQLRYLFEVAAAGGTQRFIFFCSACSCVLRASKRLSEPEKVIESLENRCPGCGSNLEGTLTGNSVNVSDEFSEIALCSPHSHRERRSLFQTAESTFGFRSGNARLDALVEPMGDRGLVVVQGRYSGILAELLCFRAQLPVASGGMDSRVVFIDGGNRSDLYLFSSFARRAGIDPRRALRRVSTSRAFTVYQLADTLTRELSRAVRDEGSKLVVVADPLCMLDDPSISALEAERVAAAMASGLQGAKSDVLVLAALASASPYDAQLTSIADILLRVEERGRFVHASLLRHHARRPGSVSFARQQDPAATSDEGRTRLGKNRPFV